MKIQTEVDIDVENLTDQQLILLVQEATTELLRRNERASEMVLAATKMKMGISPDLNNLEKQLVKENKKVAAIKAYRERMIRLSDSGTPGAAKYVGLREAKAAVDRYAESIGLDSPIRGINRTLLGDDSE